MCETMILNVFLVEDMIVNAFISEDKIVGVLEFEAMVLDALIVDSWLMVAGVRKKKEALHKLYSYTGCNVLLKK